MIDYKLINDSIEYYESKGFKRVETPWLVSVEADNITRPKDRESFQIKYNDKCLVASGEQSFLYQYMKGFLPKGTYQTVTPCFRHEPFDFTHSKTFIKNELIDTDIVTTQRLEEIVDTALTFIRKYIEDAEVVKKDIFAGLSYDIEVYGHEIGSYGIRSHMYLDWIYATGIAEPRFSNLIKTYKDKPLF